MEESKEFYNKVFNKKSQQRSYKHSIHYIGWQKLHIPKDARILDIGCGNGQFAQYLRDQGIKSYIGIDFSEVAIQNCRKKIPEYEFHVIDVRTKEWENIIKIIDVDIYVCLEFLEHIRDDIKLLKSLKKGKRIIISVPNFMIGSHVRRFLKREDVIKRYGGLIDISKYFRSKIRWHYILGKLK